MNKRVWILALLLALVPAAAYADGLSYTYVETGWVNVDPDVGDSGTGPSIGVSWGLGETLHVIGGYSDVDFDPVTMTSWNVGAGFHRSFTDSLDFVGEASYIEAEVDVPLFGTVSEDGYAVCAAVRAMLTNAFELKGEVEYSDLGTDGETSFGATGLWNVNQRFAVGAGYEVADEADAVFVGFRIKFGQ